MMSASNIPPDGMGDDAEMAFQGMVMLLNNGINEAADLFNKYKDASPLMSAGSSFVCFMQALMSFEDEKLAEAMKALEETESNCDPKPGGFMKSWKKDQKPIIKPLEECSTKERLERQVVIADAILYQAVLTFINHDIPSMVKGGWLMRKAWKHYDKSYKEVKTLFDKTFSANGNSSNNTSLPQENTSAPDVDGNGTISVNSTDLTEDTVARLMGAVSFGYGVFQLCLSLVPPKTLKLIEFFGFEGDRDTGLECLDLASKSKDMKAPIATLALLWYHTVIRPFFSLDGVHICAGSSAALSIIEKSEKDYPDSALFLFFKARVQRLQGFLDESLLTYQGALEAAAGQREVQLICTYEIGWCNLMKLSWGEAVKCFEKLKDDSRWSKAYYAYLTAICAGANGDIEFCTKTLREVPTLIKRKNIQIEIFVSKRAEKYKKEVPTQPQMVVLALEVLYLWNAFLMCKRPLLERMREENDRLINNKNMLPLKCMIDGGLYRAMGETENASQCFEETLARHNGRKDDQHVVAFSLYELGTIYTQDPETRAKGQDLLIQAKDRYKDYFFENRLNVRIQNELKRLKRLSRASDAGSSTAGTASIEDDEEIETGEIAEG